MRSNALSSDVPAKRDSRTLIAILIGVAVFACFWPALRNGFVGYDDPDYVTRNPMISAGWTWRLFPWAFTTPHASNWHPLTWMSHALDCSLFGLAPQGHHFTSLVFHAANAALVFLWLETATGFRWRCAFVALVFGLHPLHVESAVWVAERKDVLSAFFLLLALLAYTHYARHGGVRRYFLVAMLDRKSVV